VGGTKVLVGLGIEVMVEKSDPDFWIKSLVVEAPLVVEPEFELWVGVSRSMERGVLDPPGVVT